MSPSVAPAPARGPSLELGASRVVVIGAGIGGLATALSLAGKAKEVVVVERDPEPEEMDPGRAFELWKRPGVPQLHHTHLFLARLQTILRDRHPEVLADLADAGILPCAPRDLFPPTLQASFLPDPGDGDLAHLWGRRATFEYVLRRRVGTLANTRFVHDTSVEGLVLERTRGAITVRGVETSRRGERSVMDADLVVDASGARSRSPEWLRAGGAGVAEEESRSRCVYYCRHFQRADPSAPFGQVVGANLDYLVFGTFPAEAGTFSIAFACPETEPELAALVHTPEGFDRVCAQMPALERLLRTATSVSRVLGGARLLNRWRRFGAPGSRILGFFPVGDSSIQTNPVYGRGCAFAFVQAEALADVLGSERDAARRARRFERTVRRLLRPHFDFCVAADRAMMARAHLAQGARLAATERFLNFGYDQVFLPAIGEDPRLARDWLRGQGMGEVPPPWAALATVLRMVLRWIARKLSSAAPPPPASSFGPNRTQLLETVSGAARPP